MKMLDKKCVNFPSNIGLYKKVYQKSIDAIKEKGLTRRESILNILDALEEYC